MSTHAIVLLKQILDWELPPGKLQLRTRDFVEFVADALVD